MKWVSVIKVLLGGCGCKMFLKNPLCHWPSVSEQAWPRDDILSHGCTLINMQTKVYINFWWYRERNFWPRYKWLMPFACTSGVYVSFVESTVLEYCSKFTLSKVFELKCDRNQTGPGVFGAGRDWRREDCWKVFPLINQPRSLWLNVVTAGAPH